MTEGQDLLMSETSPLANMRPGLDRIFFLSYQQSTFSPNKRDTLAG